MADNLLFAFCCEQLKREFGTHAIPLFPPKKLFSLSPLQLDERRVGLERFIQLSMFVSSKHIVSVWRRVYNN